MKVKYFKRWDLLLVYIWYKLSDIVWINILSFWGRFQCHCKVLEMVYNLLKQECTKCSFLHECNVKPDSSCSIITMVYRSVPHFAWSEDLLCSRSSFIYTYVTEIHLHSILSVVFLGCLLLYKNTYIKAPGSCQFVYLISICYYLTS